MYWAFQEAHRRIHTSHDSKDAENKFEEGLELLRVLDHNGGDRVAYPDLGFRRRNKRQLEMGLGSGGLVAAATRAAHSPWVACQTKAAYLYAVS